MKISILEYDQVDPLGVLDLNLLSLGYALTPDRVALIREHDPRPFPWFGIYAVADGLVVGQVGVYRLPVMTAEGREEVGGVCAVCTHPAYGGRGIATQLLEEAHRRMRAADLRLSTLGTARHRGAYSLYRRLGYEEFFSPFSLFTRWTDSAGDSQLRAERAGAKRLHYCDEVFERASTGCLGFAIRHHSFMQTMVAVGEVALEDVWLIRKDGELVGYAVARIASAVLTVRNLLLIAAREATAALAALAGESAPDFLQVRVDQPSVAEGMDHAGYRTFQPTWTTFMVKSLVSGMTPDDARDYLGVDSKRFLISCLDVT